MWPGLCPLFQFLLIPPPHGSGSSGFLAPILLHKLEELHISALPAGGPLPRVSQGWILITQLPSDVVPHAVCFLGQRTPRYLVKHYIENVCLLG